MLASLKSEGWKGLAGEPTKQDVVAHHVVEDVGALDVGLEDDGFVAGWEVTSILLNYSEVVVEGNCNVYGNCDEGCCEPPYATERIDCSGSGRERGCDGNRNPDLGWSDVKES